MNIYVSSEFFQIFLYSLSFSKRLGKPWRLLARCKFFFCVFIYLGSGTLSDARSCILYCVVIGLSDAKSASWTNHINDMIRHKIFLEICSGSFWKISHKEHADKDIRILYGLTVVVFPRKKSLDFESHRYQIGVRCKFT